MGLLNRFSFLKKKGLLLLLISTTSTLIFFQNCAQEFQIDLNKKDLNLPDAVSPQSQFAEVSMKDRTEFPQLKMVFVIDNSYSMKAAHLNLQNSFKSMFNGGNSKNLTPFETTAFVITTAQINGQLSNSTYLKLPIIGDPLPTDLTFDSISSQHRSANLSGKIAGDIFGFHKIDLSQPSQGITQFDRFLPATTLGIQMNNQTIGVEKGISKKANEDPTTLIAEFNNRLGLLNPDRNLGVYTESLSNINGISVTTKIGEFNEVIDKESALCAIARMMRNNEPYFKAGDIASFIIVTDEEEYDVNGSQCLESIKKWNQSNNQNITTNYVDGKCHKEEYKTKVNYTKLSTPDKCKTNYTYGFKATTSYTSVNTKINYQVQINNTQLNFYKSSVSQECTMNDGIKECSAPVTSYNPASLQIGGDYSNEANCKIAVKNNGGIVDNSSYAYSCKLSQSSSNKNLTVKGDYTSNCAAAFGLIPEPYINTPSCTLNNQIVAGPSLTVNYSSSNAYGTYAANGACRTDLMNYMKTVNPSVENCTVTLNKSSTTPEVFTGSCNDLALGYCSGSKLGQWEQCSGQLVAGTSSSNATLDITQSASTNITCDTSCSQVNACSGYPSIDLKKYLTDYKSAVIGSCNIISTTAVVNSDIPKTAVVVGSESSACSSGYTFIATTAPYSKTTVVPNNTSGTEVDFVAGTNDLQKPKMDLISYFKSRSAELFGEKNFPIISTFTPKNLISKYDDLVNLTSGNREDIHSSDYSSALGSLGAIISDRINRSVIISAIDPEKMKIYKVYRRDLQTGKWSEEISPDFWSQNGNTLVFKDGFPLSLEDQFLIDYY